jgi:transcriptional regulator with XRE-family HTH domain
MGLLRHWGLPQAEPDGGLVGLTPMSLGAPCQQAGYYGGLEAIRPCPLCDGHAVPREPCARLGRRSLPRFRHAQIVAPDPSSVNMIDGCVKCAPMIGNRLAAERRRLKLSQQQVGDLLGLGRSAVAMLEADRAPLYADRLVALGEHGFDIFKILTGESGRAAAGQLLDWALALQIAERVDGWTASRGIALPPEKRIVLIKHLYSLFAARGTLDTKTLGEMLELAA